MMRIPIVICGILVGQLSFAAFTPARAAVPFQGGISVAASALSTTIVVKKKGVPGWSGPAALSARTLEERLVLSPGADE
jgi:hypothetical protein